MRQQYQRHSLYLDSCCSRIGRPSKELERAGIYAQFILKLKAVSSKPQDYPHLRSHFWRGDNESDRLCFLNLEAILLDWFVVRASTSAWGPILLKFYADSTTLWCSPLSISKQSFRSPIQKCGPRYSLISKHQRNTPTISAWKYPEWWWLFL